MATNSAVYARPAPTENILLLVLKQTFAILASLRLTVALFAMGIFIVLVGTFAQAHASMWDVVDNYFHSAIARIPFQAFFPPTWFPGLQNVPGVFYFPGGLTIGVAMAVNLLSAHAVRFKVQAKGSRLVAGAVIIALGCLLTGLVIASGHDSRGIQGQIPEFYGLDLWTILKYSMLATWAIGLALLVSTINRWTWLETGLLATADLILGVLVLSMFIRGDAFRLDDAGMRILWQLIQASIASIVLLIGSLLVFKKRGGIVVIHAGVLLMLGSELWVSLSAVEERISINQGETVNFARDIREVELAIIDTSDPEEDAVLAIPVDKLHPEQPLDIEAHGEQLRIELLKYYPNADLRRITAADENPATTGTGLEWFLKELWAGTGADVGGEIDFAAAYVKFTNLRDEKDLGTFLLSQLLTTQDQYDKLTIGEHSFQVGLRFKRTPKSYKLHLVEVRKDDYPGTSKPRNYSSTVRLMDPKNDMDSELRIWMNNPLRYAGETFYQSNYREQGGVKTTELQVVTNRGWMVPYVACMIVVYGMLAHMGGVLLRFLRRVSTGRYSADQPLVEGGTDTSQKSHDPAQKRRVPERSRDNQAATGGDLAAWILPAVMVCLVGGWLVSKISSAPKVEPAEMDLQAFGRLPLMYEGRVKPFDTFARNNLRVISNRDYYVDENEEKQPAIRWLLDAISDSDAVRYHKVFRIENQDVLQTLGLERRSGFRYSLDEIGPGIDAFTAEVDKARMLEKNQLTTRHRKLLETDRRFRTFTKIRAAFRPPPLPPLPTEEEITKDRNAASLQIQRFQQGMMAATEQMTQLKAMEPALAIPTESDAAEPWHSYADAWLKAFVNARVLGKEADENAVSFSSMLVSYPAGKVDEFNREVNRYQARLNTEKPAGLNPRLVKFEAYFNSLNAFVTCCVLYVFSGILVLIAWAVYVASPKAFRALNRSAFGIIAVTFLFHTFALLARIMISGRPPVTNLYSSAVFIGWACVLFGISIEAIFRLGFGNLTASVIGFMTLLIANGLAGDGDTFTVLQAVLDTQFWLSTHVVCVSLGYSATFAAGLLAVVYVLGGVFSKMEPDVRRILYSITYGIVCFALFFSFWGTVLGGLWADDSWGRFWGWDPKENGALIIVLWNALVLHARWCGLVKERGFAVLAVGGNIVTAWSWFGVNELSIGLHSYGFTEGALMWLGVFAISQLIIIGLGMLPKDRWMAFR